MQPVFTGCECTYSNFFIPKVDIKVKMSTCDYKYSILLLLSTPPRHYLCFVLTSKYPIFPALLQLSLMSQGFHKSRDLQESGCHSLCLNSSWSPLSNLSTHPTQGVGATNSAHSWADSTSLYPQHITPTDLAGPHLVVLNPWLHIRILCNLKK